MDGFNARVPGAIGDVERHDLRDFVRPHHAYQASIVNLSAADAIHDQSSFQMA